MSPELSCFDVLTGLRRFHCHMKTQCSSTWGFEPDDPPHHHPEWHTCLLQMCSLSPPQINPELQLCCLRRTNISIGPLVTQFVHFFKWWCAAQGKACETSLQHFRNPNWCFSHCGNVQALGTNLRGACWFFLEWTYLTCSADGLLIKTKG